MTAVPSNRMHSLIMNYAGTDTDFGVGSHNLEGALIDGGWTRYVAGRKPLMRLTEKSEIYAQKENAWARKVSDGQINA